MKKILSLVLALVMLMSVVAVASADDQVTLTFWTQDTQQWKAYFEPAIARFEADNPGIKIEAEYFASFAEKLTQSFSADTQADVIFTYSSVGDWANSGKLLPISDKCYTAEEYTATFFPGAIASKLVNGQYYAVPGEINVESPTLYVNMTLLEEIGATLPEGWVENNGPATWAELLAFAKSVTEKDSSGYITREGLSYAYAQWEALFQSLIIEFGGDFRDAENCTVHFQTEEARKALEWLLQYMGTGEDAVCAGDNSRYDSFAQGTAVMCIGAPWYAGCFDADMAGSTYQVFNAPAYVEGANPVSLSTSGWAYIASAGIAGTAKEDAAWTFIKYMSSAYENGQFCLTAGSLPCRADSLSDLQYDVNVGSTEKALAIASDVLAYAEEDGSYMLTPSKLTYTIIRQALYGLLEDGDIDACLETIQTQAETMIAENFGR